MITVNGFTIRNPEVLDNNGGIDTLIIFCPDHPSEQMTYSLIVDQFRCQAENGLCARRLTALAIWEALSTGA